MRRIHSAQAAEKQSKMEKAKQLTAEVLQKQQNMKLQKNAEAPSKTSAINDLFMASSVKNTTVKGKKITIVHAYPSRSCSLSHSLSHSHTLSLSLCCIVLKFSYISTSISS